MDQDLPQPPQFPSQQPAPKKPAVHWLLAAGIFIGLLIAGVAFGFYIYHQNLSVPQTVVSNNTSTPSVINVVTSNLLQPNNSYPVSTSTQQANLTPDNQVSSFSCNNPLPPVVSKSGEINWMNAQFEGASLFASATDTQDSDFDHEEDYLVGNIVMGPYAGGQLLVVKLYYSAPGGPSTNWVIKKNGQYYFLLKQGSPYPDLTDNVMKTLAPITQDNSYFPADLAQPLSQQLHLDNPKADFTLAASNPYAINFFCGDGLIKVFTDPTVGNVYTDISSGFQKDTNGNVIYEPHGFYVKLPDDTLAVYQLDIPITSSSNVPLVTWANGANNTEEYNYQHIGGCGASNYEDVVDVTLSELKQTGTAVDGSPIYEYSDSNNSDLQDIYQGMFVAADQTKMSYSDFAASHPVFFWKDQFGNFVRFQNSSYVPMAECGKPVIYLYPPQAEQVKVELSPVGGFSYTEPAYNGGWQVMAQPNGQLTNLADGKIYPYLFWEGRGGLYQTPDKGFMVKQSNVHEFLETKLALEGLNTKERADFEAFWEPKMRGAPYYFVTFMGNEVMDTLAPLKVTPQPDTIIRVLMDFKPLQAPLNVEGYNIATPARHGFTLVEWGGVLR